MRATERGQTGTAGGSRRRRALGLALLLALAAWPGAAPAATAPDAADQAVVVFLVRHAEKAASGEHGGDPPLNRAGRRRARELARTLASAGITHIHSTEYRRTLDTAGPLADRLGGAILTYDPGKLAALAHRLRATPGRHLVVGHSNTTAELVELLGGDGGAPIDMEREYDRLYTVVLQPAAVPVTVLQRYGDPTP